MCKFKFKKGFTLAELLIVVAIIAVLVAAAVPVFGAQLEKSRKAVDDANLRTALFLAQANVTSTGYVDGQSSTTGYFDLDSGTIVAWDGYTAVDGYNQANETYRYINPSYPELNYEFNYTPKTAFIYVSNYTIIDPANPSVPTEKAIAYWWRYV